jgi:asparaginyl-tRNA synthetase
LSKKGHTLEFLRDIAHLRPRSKYISAATRVRNSLALATHLYFQSRGFYLIATPIVTASDCEGAGEMFQVSTIMPKTHESVKTLPLVKDKDIVDYSKDFFKRPSYLTVSGQLSIECYACAMSNVYNFNPAFRSENSHTARHLSEFWMIEPEMAFADIYDNMELAEHYVRFCIQYVTENNKEDLEYFEAEQIRRAKEEKKEAPSIKLLDNLKNVMNSDFKRLSYTEGVEICVNVNILKNCLKEIG